MRSTKHEVRERITATLNIYLNGGQFHDLREHARENGWRVSDGQLRRYLQKVDETLALSAEKDREKILARHLAELRALRVRCMQVSDYPTSRLLLKDEAELRGLTSRSGPPCPDGGSPRAVLEQVYLKIVQHIEMKLPDRELSAEEIMQRARQLREEADAIERGESVDANQQPAALPG
jgi:hypothetical protein